TPDEVVAGVGPAPGAPEAPRAAVPVQRDRDEPQPKGRSKGKGPGRVVPRPRPAEAGKDADAFAPFPSAGDPAPPHLAGTDELGDADWWLAGRQGSFTDTDGLPAGFVGGVEIPDLLRPPRGPRKPKPADGADRTDATDGTNGTNGTDGVVEPGGAQGHEGSREEETVPRRWPRLRVPFPSGGWSNPLLLLAAGLLVGGAVLGNLYGLLLGWAIAYASRRLSPAETKWAVVYLPGAAVAAGVGWLWGRTRGRWGEPIAEGHMNEALAQTWPWALKGAAIASALFLVWRSQRRR
ncbi:hypothetical protein, partial [Streptomyces graminilatus]|uniref:hypothetical protein n=1 Tax=Streptomyces graminilatus TaxID=1464070 RepID=UPI0006E27F1D